MADFGSIIDSGSGVALTKAGTTVSTFALSLAAGAVLFGVQFTGFVVFRNYLWAKRIYQPRSFLVPLKDRVKPPPNNVFRWFTTVFSIQSATEVLHKAGMDAYFFLRYLTMCLKIFVPLALFILPILLPLNVVGGKGTRAIGNTTYNVTGMDVLAWSNVAPENTNRYWAHLILAIAVIAWVCYVFHSEMEHYIEVRQDYLSSASHRLKASSTTVLITDIPEELCTTEALTELYDDFPGGIRRLWINKDHQKIVEKDTVRRTFEDLLENAETNLIRTAVKKSRKSSKNSASAATTEVTTQLTQVEERRKTPTSDTTTGDDISLVSTSFVDCERDLEHDIKTQAAWTRYIEPKHREKMRVALPNREKWFKIPLIGHLFGTKVDTIYYCRRQLARLNQEMDQEIDQFNSLPPNGSAFIQFNTQKAAHLACQAIADIVPRQMTQRTVEISPADINWDSLGQNWLKRFLRLIGFLALFAVLIFVFGLLSFFTGILSRVSTLGGSAHWLRWVATLPTWLLSFVQGTLPSVILIIVLSGPTPIVLRAMTNGTRAAITGTQGERSLQVWYFIFLLLELFIIPTISSGLTSIVKEIVQNTSSVPEILATNLPTASNYYFSFLVVQALSISASSIFQTVRMFNYYALGKVNTPDALFAKLTFTHLTRIGSNIPWYTTFAVIGLVYSVIAPLMLIFVIGTFSLFWIVIKNNVLYVVRTGPVDSGALWFPQAITQTFTGLYFMELCLIGLFFLVRDDKGKVACDIQGIIMAVCVVLTLIYHIWLTTNFHGLVTYAPLRLTHHDRENEMQRLSPLSLDEKPTGKNVEMIDRRFSSRDEAKPGSSPEEAIEPPNPNSFRDRRTSTRSMAVLDRSKNMQAQQVHDEQKAHHILARLNRPLDEARLSALEAQLATVEARVGNALLPRTKDIEARMMNDPISKIIMQHNDELEDLSAEERDMLISVAFTHPVLRAARPAVWIPQDHLGISEDEVQRMQTFSKHLVVDNRGAFLNQKLKIEIDKAPPDMSEFALVMAEL